MYEGEVGVERWKCCLLVAELFLSFSVCSLFAELELLESIRTCILVRASLMTVVFLNPGVKTEQKREICLFQPPPHSSVKSTKKNYFHQHHESNSTTGKSNPFGHATIAPLAVTSSDDCKARVKPLFSSECSMCQDVAKCDFFFVIGRDRTRQYVLIPLVLFLPHDRCLHQLHLIALCSF